jgi:hypothetical protein
MVVMLAGRGGAQIDSTRVATTLRRHAIACRN